MSESLKLLQSNVRKQAKSPGSISPGMVLMCEVIDHLFYLHRQDVADLREENRKLKADVFKLKTVSEVA